MRVAVISDIHGNYKALEAFLNHIETMDKMGQRIDEILCLGDYFTDGPDPQRVMRLLKQMMEMYPCHFVLGNREEYLLNNLREPQGWKPSSASGMLYFVAQRLTPEIVKFMENLPMTEVVQIEGYPSMIICHGSPTNTRSNFMEDPGKHAHCMKHISTPFLIGGHTHRQEVARLYNKIYLNPGALGLAVDGIGRKAPFAILNGIDGDWNIELKSINYDIDTYLREFADSHMEEEGYVLARATKKTLLTGINYFFKAVVLATRKARAPIKEVPEEIWEETARELGIE